MLYTGSIGCNDGCYIVVELYGIIRVIQPIKYPGQAQKWLLSRLKVKNSSAKQSGLELFEWKNTLFKTASIATYREFVTAHNNHFTNLQH